ncbi:hypothetical protein BASA81_005123 [Batrachochytrium salamandrivorans]|nr:hypothetical protein BASA81_005123 [Batrachochytrium salamandrivorans]
MRTLFRRTTSSSHHEEDHPPAASSSAPFKQPKLSFSSYKKDHHHHRQHHHHHAHHGTAMVKKSLVSSFVEEDVPEDTETAPVSVSFLNTIKDRVVSIRKPMFQDDSMTTTTATSPTLSILKKPVSHKKNSSLDFVSVHVADEDMFSDDDDYDDEEEYKPAPVKKPFGTSYKKISELNSDTEDEDEEDDYEDGEDGQQPLDKDEHKDVVSKQKKNVRGMLAIRRTSNGGSSSSDSSGNENSELDSDGDEEGDGEDDVIEDLFDETLEEIQQQELLHLAQNQAPKSSVAAAAAAAAPLDFNEVLRQVPFFAQFSAEHQVQLFSVLEEESFGDGDSIVQQGEVGDKFYTIVHGEAVVSKRNKDTGEEKDLTHIYPGDFFGEMVLIYGGERVASVTSVGNTKCMTLSRKSFEQYPLIRYFLILQKVPLLNACSKKVQLEIVSRLKPVVFNQGEYVVKQGEHGDAFFMITKGSASVIEDEVKVITNLYEGHSFGEMSLLRDEPRVASVKATSELHLMLLSVKDFKELLTGEEDFSQLLEQESRKIRELRDKRGGMKVVASRDTLPVVDDSPKTPPIVSLSTKTPGKQVAQLQQLPHSSHSQQKLRVGKTAGGKKIINNYVILDEIGRGAFGVVKLCEHNETGERYAIKIIDKTLFKNKIASKHQTTMEDMRREASIMKDLHHRNVVELIDVIDDPKADQLYIVQEYCALGAVMENLEGSIPLDESTARKYFRDLLCGIDYLHTNLIVHRDIKPMNLFLTEYDVVKIGDFGSARVFKQQEGGDMLQTMLNIAGTPAFMAPELLGQESSLYDGPLVDLWSCGATLFMLVTGVPPWMADDEPTLAKRVQNDELVFPSTGKKLSPHLKNVLTRLLVKDPKGRMDLAHTMSHEWVTEEGSDPLPRYNAPKPFSSMQQMVTVTETEVLTPGTPTGRKQPESQQQRVAGLMSSGSRKLSMVNFSLFGSMRKDSSVLLTAEDDHAVGGRERGESTTDFSLFDVGKSYSGLNSTPVNSGDRPLSMFFGRTAGSHSAKKKPVVQGSNVTGGLRTQFNRLSLANPLVLQSMSASGVFSVGSGGTQSRRASLAREEEEDEIQDGSVEMSLSAILNDPSLFKAMKRNKEFDNDKTLLSLPAKIQVVKATRGNIVKHCSLRYGFAEAQGQRLTMEDCVAIVPRLPGPDTFFAAIFDGHGGDLVSKELKSKFHKVLNNLSEFSAEYSASAAVAAASSTTSPPLTPTPLEPPLHHNSSVASMSSLGANSTSTVTAPANPFGDSFALPIALRRTCLKLDKNIMQSFANHLLDMESKIELGDEKKGLFRTKGGGKQLENQGSADLYRKAGSTAVVALVRGGSNPKKQPGVLTVAWVGDSRAVLCRAGKPVEVSKDHKAEREDEKARIRANAGKVDRQGRLYGDLAVSRAFGDLQHKGRELRAIVSNNDENVGAEGTLIALPDVVQIVLTAQDEFLILASDGVWDVMSNEQVCNYVRFHLNRHGDVRKAALELVDKALEMHSVDNVSVVIIGFGGKF